MGKIVEVTTLVLFGAFVLEAGAAAGQVRCSGDLDGNQNVSVSQLVTAVTRALDGCPFPPATRFVDNGNGTITDHKTGLMLGFSLSVNTWWGPT